MRAESFDNISRFAQTLRRDSLALLFHAGSGHPGGALSCADIVAYLWTRELEYSSDNWERPDRNRLILSKGHSVATVYAAAGQAGLLPSDTSNTLRHTGSPLQGHPHVLSTPWVETSTGSLGQGFSVAIGIALGLRHQGISSRVFVILGDGELQEGEVWEGAMCAAQFSLDKLCVFVDYNKLQSDDQNKNIMGVEPLADKWTSFGWDVSEIDGHDIQALHMSVQNAKRNVTKPSVIIAHTIKGKGVSYMENVPSWHGSVQLKRTELIDALSELNVKDHEMDTYLIGSFWK